jgi:hypothetical protein
MNIVPTGGGDIVQQIGNLIRYWVHYDNTLSELNKKVKSTRDTRNNYETQILEMLKKTNLAQPVIQIGGSRLIISEDKHSSPLTFTNLDSLLHQYYATKPGARDETSDIIKFIKANRDVVITPCLKRQGPPRSRSNSDTQ